MEIAGQLAAETRNQQIRPTWCVLTINTTLDNITVNVYQRKCNNASYQITIFIGMAQIAKAIFWVAQVIYNTFLYQEFVISFCPAWQLLNEVSEQMPHGESDSQDDVT
jgi:hypothetical protein